MKKFARKNQWIITALAVLIAVAGYLNFTGQEIDKNGWKSVMSLSGKETAAPQENADAVRENADAAAQEEMTGQKKESKKTSADTTLDISAQEDGGDYTVADSGELKSASEENPGEAVMVSNSLGADYFSSAKLSREQSRAKNKETLMTIINNDKIASKDKKSAIDQVAQLTKDAQLESAAELMLEAKGFTDSVVSIEKGSADVIVNAGELTQQQLAQITDIVTRKTKISADNIVITPVAVK
ncbi:SpoIIIAH-like family protein [Roseburia sp. AM59-24XD]|jgi:stage III sporulation protein AH|uniref:SpoIIIAH-like family protein n=1 Tax=Roseburia sp. AM59-24XD TaxID=2293138 RepID=UPI000E4860D9|nr:SpoIIIAH-like family protein [Roseburia sp. AM59-24XD]RHP85785.1 SpoIIIAH-like family protein [Roseburia sp. AM59-24XD]